MTCSASASTSAGCWGPLSDPQQPADVDADAEHVILGGPQDPEEREWELSPQEAQMQVAEVAEVHTGIRGAKE
jgi:hypothetical protein